MTDVINDPGNVGDPHRELRELYEVYFARRDWDQLDMSAEPPRMVRRSWYRLPAEAADRLDQVADQLWRAVPGIAKHEALTALLDAGIARADEIRTQLTRS